MLSIVLASLTISAIMIPNILHDVVAVALARGGSCQLKQPSLVVLCLELPICSPDHHPRN
jgi:hypothetical protein